MSVFEREAIAARRMDAGMILCILCALVAGAAYVALCYMSV